MAAGDQWAQAGRELRRKASEARRAGKNQRAMQPGIEHDQKYPAEVSRQLERDFIEADRIASDDLLEARAIVRRLRRDPGELDVDM